MLAFCGFCLRDTVCVFICISYFKYASKSEASCEAQKSAGCCCYLVVSSSSGSKVLLTAGQKSSQVCVWWSVPVFSESLEDMDQC